MSRFEYHFLNYVLGLGITLWTILAVALMKNVVLGYGFDHTDRNLNPLPTTGPSLLFELFFGTLLVGIYSIGLIGALAVWDEEWHKNWKIEKAKKKEKVEISRSQKRLRELALIAVENDVMDSIATGNKVAPETAALLFEAQVRESH